MLKSYFFNWVCLEGPTNWQVGFQNPASPIIIGIIDFHNYVMSYLVGIVFFVSWLLLNLFQFQKTKHQGGPGKFTHSTALEVVWTISPGVILLFIANQSFALLYSIDDLVEPEFTVKIVGHQWYWSYEYSDFVQDQLPSLCYDSYIVTGESEEPRLFAVDRDLCLPTKTHLRLLITSSDVLHSWAVPSLGIKVDACPGRLNQSLLYILREGVFYGQCSEICGINHGFIPIAVQAKNLESYDVWLLSMFVHELELPKKN
jgi:cytochrome c oxidase subunit 2